MENRFVIAISAVSGGGKSALANGLLPLLGDAIILHFDDYSPVYCPTSTYPHDFRLWLEEGADPNAWQTPHQHCDLVLDGTKPIDELAREASKRICSLVTSIEDD